MRWGALLVMVVAGCSSGALALEDRPSTAIRPGDDGEEPAVGTPSSTTEGGALIVEAGPDAMGEDAATLPPSDSGAEAEPPPPPPVDAGEDGPCVESVTTPSRATYVGKVTYESTAGGTIKTLFFYCQTLDNAAACEKAIKLAGLITPATCHVDVPSECQVCTNAGSRW
jgi:hypothetical protein